jgi:hypothetical protein
MTKIVIGVLAASFMLISVASAQKYPERTASTDHIVGNLAPPLHGEGFTKSPILNSRD